MGDARNQCHAPAAPRPRARPTSPDPADDNEVFGSEDVSYRIPRTAKTEFKNLAQGEKKDIREFSSRSEAAERYCQCQNEREIT